MNTNTTRTNLHNLQPGLNVIWTLNINLRVDQIDSIAKILSALIHLYVSHFINNFLKKIYLHIVNLIVTGPILK